LPCPKAENKLVDEALVAGSVCNKSLLKGLAKTELLTGASLSLFGGGISPRGVEDDFGKDMPYSIKTAFGVVLGVSLRLPKMVEDPEPPASRFG
jgi:hypothetical protein